MIETPNQYKYIGPWYLTRKAAQSLDEALLQWFEGAVDRYLKDKRAAAKKYWGAQRADKDEPHDVFDDMIEDALRSEQEGSSTKCTLTLKGDKRIIGKSFREVLSNRSLDNSQVVSAEFKATLGSSDVTVTFTSSRTDGLNIAFHGLSEQEKESCMDEIDLWMSDHQESGLVRRWIRWRFWMVGVIWIAFVSIAIIDNDGRNTHRETIRQEMRSILAQGDLSDSDLDSLIILLAELASGFARGEDNGATGLRLVLLLPLLGFAGIVTWFSPKTEIEYGRSRHRIAFWKAWEYLWLLLIPGSILLPILINAVTARW